MSVPFTAIGPVVSSGGGDPDEIAEAVWAYATRELTGAAVLDPASVSAIRDGIPKVGETHRYTQVDSGATTTDVSIGEAT